MSEAEILHNFVDPFDPDDEDATPVPGLYLVKIDRGSGFWNQEVADQEKLRNQELAQLEQIAFEIGEVNAASQIARVKEQQAISDYQALLATDPSEAEISAARRDLQKASKAWWKYRAQLEYLGDIQEKHRTALDACDKRLRELAANGPTLTREVWAADGYEQYQPGEFVRVIDLTIEVPVCVIAPVFDREDQINEDVGAERWRANKHGYRLQRRLHSPAALALNLVSMPAVQQERPRYRAARILEKTTKGALVEYDKVYSSATLGPVDLSADPFGNDIRQQWLNARYGNRGLGAFVAGDHVLVKIYDNDWDSPKNKIIGFISNPRKPWVSYRLGRDYLPDRVNNGGTTLQNTGQRFGRWFFTDINYAELIRQGRQVDVLWNGSTNLFGEPSDEWQQSHYHYEIKCWIRRRVEDIDTSPDPGFQTGSLNEAPANVAFAWTQGPGDAVNGQDTYNFIFYEDADYINGSGSSYMPQYWFSQNNLKNVFYFWAGKNAGGPNADWLNLPAQCAIYVDGCLSQTFANLMATTYYGESLWPRIPFSTAPNPWKDWPLSPFDSPVFKYPDDFNVDALGGESQRNFAYWEAYDGIVQDEALLDLGAPPGALASEWGYWNGTRRISDRWAGYVMKEPPLLGDSYPLPQPIRLG